MKSTLLLTGACAAALLSSANAADTTITLTGASAFRTATLDTIKARYASTGQPFKFAHDLAAGQLNASTRSVFIGTFPGVTGTTTIRCTFNGSVEGLNALTSGSDTTTYLQPSVLGSTTATVAGAELPSTTSPVAVSAPADMAYSDVSKASTPFASANLLPADPVAGIVTFTMIANEGAPAGLTNVTAKQFQALFGNGYLPLSVFTGVEADNGTYVFATGRNDGSGTRTTYLAETGYGITKTVQQYVAGVTTGSTISQIHRVPQGGYSIAIAGSGSTNRSTIWGQDVDGNGGYNSGGSLRTDMGKTSASTTVLDADGSELLSGSQIHLITFLSTADALAAFNAGAKYLSYNGVGITPIASGLSPADKAKVTEGQYTAWGYEYFYRRGDITSGDKEVVYTGIKNNLILGATGIPVADMHVGRTVDGGPVAP
jgi:hypothetical protein